MKPAGRSANVLDRLGNIYIHRASRWRRMPTIRLKTDAAHYVVRSVENLNGDPDAASILMSGRFRMFGIPLRWEPVYYG